MYIKYPSFWYILFHNVNSSYEYLLIIYFIQKQMFHHVVLTWTLNANKPTCSEAVYLQQVRRSVLFKHFLYLLIRLRTDWIIYRWHLFRHEAIHEFVKFLEEQNDHVSFLHDIWWCYAVHRYTSLFFQLYWRSFLLLCLTTAICC